MNYWILQANPRTRFIVHFYLKKQQNDIESNTEFHDWWVIPLKGVSPRDIIFIWKAAGEPKKNEAPEYNAWRTEHNIETGGGIYAVGEVDSVEPWEGPPYDHPKEDKYHVIPARNAPYEKGWRVNFRYVRNMVDAPLLESKLWDDNWCMPGLQDLKRKMSYRGKRAYAMQPSWGQVIDQLIFEHSIPPSETWFPAQNKVYKPRGEGEEHKQIKAFAKANAARLFGKGAVFSEEEYSFDSGDRADLVFELSADKWVAVEVEPSVDGNDIVGLLQAIKYRYMFPVQKKISSEKVRGALVARSIDKSVKELCQRYGIEWYEVNVEESTITSQR